MKRFLISSLSAVVSFGLAAPAFAYIIKNDDISVQTSPYGPYRLYKRHLDTFAAQQNRSDRVYTHYNESERYVAPVTTNRVIPKQANGAYNRTRGVATDNTTGRSNLSRGVIQAVNLRRLKRMEKPGFGMYRILDIRPNTRSLRQQVESTSESSYLPESLVQTGGNTVSGEWGYDRPTRRAIREGGHYGGQVDDRDRYLLTEMSNSARDN